MTEREQFLRAIAENDDVTFRLVYADWLDDHGEHEEAERQRKWPEAKEWLDNICRSIKVGYGDGETLPCDQLLEFGRRVSMTANAEIVFSMEDEDGIPYGSVIATAIRDQIPQFWRAWSIVTGLPLRPDIEQKSYVDGAWECCPIEVYPESHLAGPKPERFLRAEQEEARLQREEEHEQQMNWAEQFDTIQDELENDRS